MTFTRSAEQQQFASSLHDLLAAADVPGAASHSGEASSSPASSAGTAASDSATGPGTA